MSPERLIALYIVTDVCILLSWIFTLFMIFNISLSMYINYRKKRDIAELLNDKDIND